MGKREIHLEPVKVKAKSVVKESTAKLTILQTGQACVWFRAVGVLHLRGSENVCYYLNQITILILEKGDDFQELWICLCSLLVWSPLQFVMALENWCASGMICILLIPYHERTMRRGSVIDPDTVLNSSHKGRLLQVVHLLFNTCDQPHQKQGNIPTQNKLRKTSASDQSECQRDAEKNSLSP